MDAEDREDRIEMLREAQEKMVEAIELIEQAISDTKIQANTEAYLLDHLKIMASNGHGYLSKDLNMDDVIERLS